MMYGLVTETILLVCDEEVCASEVLTRLYDNGYSVVGPAGSAKLALALAAQTGTSLGLIARPPTGRRKARELAQELLNVWGVRTLILDEALEGDAVPSEEAFWAPPQQDRVRLERALGR